MSATTKEDCAAARTLLHDLVERLPQDVLEQAGRVLIALVDDPLYRTFLAAPLDDEPITEADIEALEAAKQERLAGRLIPWEAIRGAYLTAD